MGDVNLEIKLNNIDERVIKIEESGGSGGDGYITSVSNDFNVLNKKLSLSNDVTTKLSKVDNKIDKPTTATEGQVLTYKNNEWVADDAKGGVDEPTELEKGIIGGDEWVSGGNYTIGKSVVIDENKLYLLVGDGGSTTKPSTDATHSIWEETSISALNSKLNDKLINKVSVTQNNVTTISASPFSYTAYDLPSGIDPNKIIGAFAINTGGGIGNFVFMKYNPGDGKLYYYFTNVTTNGKFTVNIWYQP